MPEYEVNDDGIYKIDYMFVDGMNKLERKILPKEIFIEAFEKWIEKPSDNSLDLLEERINAKAEKLFAQKLRELIDKRVNELVSQREFLLYKENLELKNRLIELTNKGE